MNHANDGEDCPAGGEKLLAYVGHSEGVPATTRVIEAVASASDTDATELPPLHDSVDTDALNVLFDSGGPESDRSLRVSFVYDGYAVRIDRDGVAVGPGPSASTDGSPWRN